MHIPNNVKPFADKTTLTIPILHKILVKSDRNLRLCSIAGAGILLLLMLISGGRYAAIWLSHNPLPFSRLAVFAILYAFSTLIALLFFGVGAVIWLYGRQRRVAALLFAFCCMLMIAFASMMGANVGYDLFNAVGNSCCALAIPLLSALLLSFPDDVFARTMLRPRLHRFLQCYLVLSIVGSLLSVSYSLITYMLHIVLPSWYYLLGVSYFAVGIAAIVLIVFFSWRHVNSVRTRQQFRLFLNGIVLSLAPILALTVIPTLFHSPFVVPGTISMLFLVCFPLTLGYAVLRYQILVLDTYIRRYISWMTDAILLAILIYIVLAGCNIIFGNQLVLQLITATLLLPLPSIWLVKKMNTLTERLFFSEMLHYRRLVNALPLQMSDSLHLPQITRALIAAACDTFASPAACIFILNEAQDRYTLFPTSAESEMREQEHNLLSSLRSSFPLLDAQPPTFVIDVNLPLLSILRDSPRPLTLHELLSNNGQRISGVAKYLVLDAPSSSERNPLFVPLRVQGTMIALLLLDERGDHEPYAGPDFEGINLLLSRFLPLFETTWLTQELQASNERLQTANERLSELDILKNQFIMSTSHELRTPLTSVSGYVDLLLEHGDQLTHEQHIEFLRKAAVSCDELVQQVAVISDAGRLQFELKQMTLGPCSLNEVVMQATEIMGIEALHQQRTIHVDLPAAVTVFASSHHIREVLLNLLSNAFKYSAHGTPVSIRALPQSGKVTVSVQDSGFGVPPGAQTYLFERFVRLERDMNSPIRGAGLGLAICKQLVETMGGHIWLVSNGIPGEGSTFFFTLKSFQL